MKLRTRQDLRALLLRHNLSIRANARVPRTGFVRVSTNGAPVDATVTRLLADPRVEWAEPNYQRRLFARPNDHFFRVRKQTYLRRIRLPRAWNREKGSRAKLAIVDNGVDRDHPDLKGRVLLGRDFTKERCWRKGAPLQCAGDALVGHGTQMAGAAAAKTNNGRGIAGVAWRARILPVKVTAGSLANDAAVAAGIVWAADRGATVINVSLGGPKNSRVLRAAIRHANRRDSLVVAAAGNFGTAQRQYPAAYPRVLAVTATDARGDYAWFSSYGKWVDIAAPGTNIISTFSGAPGIWRYKTDDGSSFSSALTSGAAFLIRAQHPGWSAQRVKRRITRRAQDRGPRGRDLYYGGGWVDPFASLGGSRRSPHNPRGDIYEPNNSRSTATPLSSAVRVTIAPEGDIDWFSIRAPGPGTVTFTATPRARPMHRLRHLRARELDPVLRVYGPGGEPLDRRDDGWMGQSEGISVEVASAGTYYVRVRNRWRSMSPGPYVVGGTYSSSRPPRFSLAKAQGWDESLRPEATTVADVTGDDLDDVLMTAWNENYDDPQVVLYLFEQQADGTLGHPQEFRPTWEGGMGIHHVTVDIDQDGRMDVLIGRTGGLAVYHEGDGTLTGPDFIPLEGAGYLMDVEDVDLDGDLDIVVVNNRGVVLAEATEDGFVDRTIVPADPETSIRQLEVGDVTADGLADVVILEEAVVVYTQDSAGAFQRSDTVMRADGIELADVTGDGRDDLAAVNTGSGVRHKSTAEPTGWGGLVVWEQRRSGGLGRRVEYPVVGYEVVESADMNADGLRDLVFAQFSVELRLQMPHGVLDGGHARGIGNVYHIDPYSVGIGDIDGNGLNDVTVTHWNEGLLLVRQL